MSQFDWSIIHCWNDLEDKIRVLSTVQARGEAFEEFCHAFFTHQKDFYQARNIWRFKEIPENILNQIGLNTSQDRGIDGLLQQHDGTFTAYQAKFRSDRADTPSQHELSTFYMISDRVNFRLVVSNVQNLPSIATERKDHGHILVDTLLELSPDFFQCLKDHVCSDYLHHEPPPVAKPFQIEALDAILQGFRVSSRGQAILACGAGKTLLGKWVVDRLGSKRILVMFPSLALVRQTMGEWYRAQSGTFRYICICSDPTVDVYREEDEWETQPSELDVRVSTNAQDLVVFFSKNETVPQVVFSTYQSGSVIVEALKNPALENFHFDLVICDEAHRVAGTAGRAFSSVLDDNLVRAKYRLFMTATPKILSPRLSEKDSTDSNLICSMDDHAMFGPVFYRFPFSEAIHQGVICDYRVVVIGVSEEEILDLIREGGTIQIEDSETWKAEVLAQRIALCKAIANYGIQKIFTFHNRVSAAAHFVNVNTPDSFPSVLKKFSPNLQYMASHIEGKMSAGIRNNILRTFSLSTRGVVSNARCLGEGVNVPIVDGIFFAEPRKSVIDIVQATGRALRKVPGKDRAYIIIPVLVKKGEEVDQILEESKFDTVWQVLSAMTSQDERLDATIKEVRIKQGEGAIPRLGDSGGSFHSEFIDTQTILMGFPKHIPFSVYQKAFSLEAIEKLGERWHLRFGALKDYVKHHGKEPSKEDEFEGFKIGAWLQAQRTAYRKKKLPEDRANLLKELDIDLAASYDLQQSWEEHLEGCKKFLKEEGRLPSQGEEFWVSEERTALTIKEKMKNEYSSLGPGFLPGQVWEGTKLLKVGNWLGHQRRFYRQGKLSNERIEKMEKELKLVWDPTREKWERNFAAYKAFVEKTGLQPDRRTKFRGVAIGNWTSNNVRKAYKEGKLSDEQIKNFESLGMVWSQKKSTSPKTKKPRFPGQHSEDILDQGYSFLQDTSLWIDLYAKCKEYIKEFNSPPLPGRIYFGFPIGSWLESQCYLYELGKLPDYEKEKISLLKNLINLEKR
ncbi:DEAD/DEAH box helicase [Candidatus Nitronereus thalassa]|uniref:Helicase associated domain protein n=1 Tax=Candidatus Nitronereus thalassa TaxID=3020898 RepID=A0ABU3K865_9BACT|nr:Helicase associated domain protein [Candidatus Nitronereus thalassa]MDT7042538.1 Helicase associated domain protein [Candidatus Nitronereus thalassa]